ncbi:adhesin [Stenotrophomonas sp. PS02289]|uniref:adhesin n=1 Tax=Stenotrophomonas sp. PS02289 TaxID=2991422 RepID=UPI00249BE4E9|nr:adhesin [Stenotrophomonas sp. PS02289]
MKRTVLALAIAVASASVAANPRHNGPDIDTRIDTHIDTDIHTDIDTNIDTDIDTNIDTNIRNDWDSRTKIRNTSTTNTSSNTSTDTRSVNHTRNVTVNENVQKHSNIQADERQEKNNHGVDVNLESDLQVGADVKFRGRPTVSGDLEVNSAAIAIIDNRQSVMNNEGENELLENNSSISENVAQNASGNLGFNTAAGDNNAQDNAAALSAADASFTFGMSDAQVYVDQYGAGNSTWNDGVVNNSSLSGNAFRGATGNIGVNSAAGNNNEQKNALAASVSTARMATASIASKQISEGNSVSNEGYVKRMQDTTEVTLRGTVRGGTAAIGVGGYRGTGNAYQSSNLYADSWTGGSHSGGNSTGHIDFDNETQGAVQNPNREGVGGFGFDTEEEGVLAFGEVGYADLRASLSGTVATTRWVVERAENNASLSGDAFRGASGNIGVNVAAGTGNLQANSLALAVAQPSAAGPGGPGE